jgi:hypothetical protein
MGRHPERHPRGESVAKNALPAAPLEPETETLEKYYTHPKFSPIPRRIHKRQINLPENFTDFILLFILFYPFEHVETFVYSTNQYAEEKMELERKEDSSLPDHSRYLNWKPLTIREVYIFLGILILMGSDRKPKIEDYWSIPCAAGKTPSAFHNYIGLKRFQTIHKLFTVSPTSVSEACTNNPPRYTPTPKRKPTTRNAPLTNNTSRKIIGKR